jgi:hypothetical protein
MSDEVAKLKEQEEEELRVPEGTPPAVAALGSALHTQQLAEKANLSAAEKLLSGVFEAMLKSKEYVSQASGILTQLEENIAYFKLRDLLKRMALFYTIGFQAGRAYQHDHPTEDIEIAPGPRLVV